MKAGLIARFKPLHDGAALMLEHACRSFEHVKIGIGSCNKYNARNPFTAEESSAMIDAFLGPLYDNYETIMIPDYGHCAEYKDGMKWKAHLMQAMGSLDCFITSNPYVERLLCDTYRIVHPSSIIPIPEWMQLRATEVRVLMARGEDYRHLVPEKVAAYMEQNGLPKRFRKEFGLETLCMYALKDYKASEGLIDELLHAGEG